MTNRIRLALLLPCTLALTVACGGGDSSGPPAVASVVVTASSSDVIVGQTAQLTATARDASGNALANRTVTWSTSSTPIATVSTAGLVTGVAVGQATITATVEGKTASQPMNVLPVPVATVTVSAAASTVQTGSTTQLTAVTRDAANNVVTGRNVSWSTSNAAIASVSTNGLVTGLTAGTVTITATSEGRTGSTDIVVTTGNPADAPTVSAISPATIVEGQNATITGTKFSPNIADNVVRVGGVAASVTNATTTSLQIVVPTLNCKPAQNINVDVSVGGLTSAPKAQPFTPGATFSLAQGQQRILSNSSGFCLQFAATSATESYLVGIQSVSENVGSVTSANVVAEGPGSGLISQTFALPALMMARPPLGTRSSFGVSLTDAPADARSIRLAKHRAVEAAFLERDRGILQARLQAAKTTARASRASFASVPTVPGNVKVGDVLNIRVPNRNTSSTCTNFIPIAATVKIIGQRGIFLEDNANPTGGFSAADYQSLSDQFDAKIYATDVAYFGAPTDFDNNTRVVIVLTKEVNKIENLLGQVFFADLFPDECPSSNDGEFFYGRTPDPSGTAGAAYTVADALLDAPIIIAHEFTHLIQIGRRITYPPATAVQSTWELEGQATFSEEVNGYAVTGLAPGQNLGFETAFNNPTTQPISWFADTFVDLAVYYGFTSATTRAPGAPEQCSWLGTRSQGNTGPCLTGREPYGVPASFLRWLSDQFGGQFPGGEKALHQALIDNAFTGFATINSVIGVPMETLLAQWAAMLYADDRVPNIDPKLTMKSWNLFAISQRLNANARLTPRDRPFGAFTDQISVRGGSSAYFIVSGGPRSATGLRVRDISDGPLPVNMQVWVVRIQ